MSNTLSIENLHVGEYVALTGFKIEVPQNPWMWNNSPQIMDGVPNKILAISPPFILVEPAIRPQGDDGLHRFALDFRAYHMTKVTEEYALAWRNNPRSLPSWKQTFTEKEVKPSNAWSDALLNGQQQYVRGTESADGRPLISQEKPDDEQHACIRCGARMIQRHYLRPVPSWHRVCPECGFDLGPIDNGGGSSPSGLTPPKLF